MDKSLESRPVIVPCHPLAQVRAGFRVNWIEAEGTGADKRIPGWCRCHLLPGTFEGSKPIQSHSKYSVPTLFQVQFSALGINGEPDPSPHGGRPCLC